MWHRVSTVDINYLASLIDEILVGVDDNVREELSDAKILLESIREDVLCRSETGSPFLIPSEINSAKPGDTGSI